MVDFGTSTHTLSRKDQNSAELETVRGSRNPTTVVTANGEVQTNEEATVCVYDLGLFVTVQILEDTPAVLSLGKLCEDHGYSCERTVVKNHTLFIYGRNIRCNTENCAPIIPALSTGSSSFTTRTSSLAQVSTENSLSNPATIRRQSSSSHTDPALGNLLHHLPEWLEDFTENLVVEGVSASRDTPASTSRDSEPPRKVVSRKHEIAKYAREPRLQGLLAGNALVMQYFEPKTCNGSRSQSAQRRT